MRTKIQRSGANALNFIKANSDLFMHLKAGDLVEGVVIEKTPRQITVDLGRLGTGVVYRGELINAKNIVRGLDEGDAIQAKVVETDNNEGFIELSLSAAEKQKNWAKIDEVYEKEDVLSVKIVDANKGGLMADLGGVQAFLPASQLMPDNYPDVEDGDKKKIEIELQQLIGKTLEVRVINADKRLNKLIISEKAAKEISSRELAKNYEVGQVVDVVVSGVADFGAFVRFADNPDVEGLIHISELAYRLVESPKEIVNPEDAIKAKIIDISADGKISLSLKALEEDPWAQMEEIFSVGQKAKGKIYSLNPFGATVSLEGGFQGQVHITEFGGKEKMEEALKPGDEIEFFIKEINSEQKRINLSLDKGE